MKNTKQIGIWMNHSSAFLMECTGNVIVKLQFLSTFTHKDKIDTINKNEKTEHNKQQGEEASYYKKISDAIISYSDVLLLGSTDAKNELYNILRANHLYDNIKIEVITTDKLDNKQMQKIVKDYFRTRS